MRIAIGLVNLVSGGTEYQMCLLADGLRSRGHDVIFYLSQGTHGSDYSVRMLDQFLPFQVNVSTSSKIVNVTLIQFFYYILECRHWFKRDKIDVAIGSLALAHLAMTHAAWGLGIPVIGRRGFAWENLGHIPAYARMRKILRQYRWWSEPRTTALVVNAEHVRRSVQRHEGWSSGRIRLIRNGFPERDPIDWKSTRAVYSAKDRIEKDWRVKGVERITDVPDWSQVGIYVHPTQSEGCSNSLGMAMAHAIPIVAYECVGNRELVGKYIHLSRLGNLYEMESSIQTLSVSSEVRRQHGLACQRRVRQEFSLKVMVDQWESLLKEVTA